jgi:hypothetical protein
MPRIAIDITDATAAKLAERVARYNADTGATLTVPEWLYLHVRELAIETTLVEAHGTFQKQAEEQARLAFAAERQRLLDGHK